MCSSPLSLSLSLSSIYTFLPRHNTPHSKFYTILFSKPTKHQALLISFLNEFLSLPDEINPTKKTNPALSLSLSLSLSTKAMNASEPQRQDSLKRRWQERRQQLGDGGAITPSSSHLIRNPNSASLHSFPGFLDDDIVSTMVPPVTVVLQGRSICQRISLQKHASYQSLAKALRQMFVDGSDVGAVNDKDLDLSNAVPGHVIAYEDMENDLLLAGDLNWKDFVRVAKNSDTTSQGKFKEGKRGA